MRTKDLRAAAIAFAVSTGVGVVMGVIGPFGTYLNGSAPVRIAYWVASLWAGWVLFGLTVPRLARWAYGRGISVWLWAPVAVAVLAVPVAAATRLLADWIWSEINVEMLEWYGQCVVISALVTGGLIWRMDRVTAEAPAPLSVDPRDRLPANLGREIVCLQMEDHYVRVHTTRGSDLVLMSLSQAMAGLADVEGQQTHRSWWVARRAMVGLVEEGRNLRLMLTGGLTAPVSRARVARLRAAGWL